LCPTLYISLVIRYRKYTWGGAQMIPPRMATFVLNSAKWWNTEVSLYLGIVAVSLCTPLIAYPNQQQIKYLYF
jgi:hypothetical protein